jgi:sterol 3beta-glucosyltransferase
VIGKLFILPTNRFRARVGAPPARDITDLMSKCMILLPVSSRVAPPDPRWPQSVKPTGYWFAREDPCWSPPAELAEFLRRGERPVAVSLGIMSTTGPQALEGAKIMLEALRQSKVRAIIQGWNETLRGLEHCENIYHAGSLPHGWLFDQVSAVIHHGGFGTTASVLRSGAPGIVIPHVIDQFYWGQRVSEWAGRNLFLAAS